MNTELQNLYSQLRVENNFTFLALAGKEGLRTTYIVSVDFFNVIELFKPVPHNPDSKLLVQRETHKSRVSAVSTYLTDNYASLPSTGAIVETIHTEHVIENIYRITIPKEAFRYFFDGQARLGGISQLLSKDISYGNNTLTVKFVKTEGLEKDNQLFNDWNSASIRPNPSICKAMDSRAIINRFTKKIINESHIIVDLIDFNKASVTASSKSNKIWTLNQFTTFVQTIAGVTAKSAENILDDKAQKQTAGFIHKYLEVLSEHPQLKPIFNRTVSPTSTRNTSIVGTSVWLKSIALTGRFVCLHLLLSTDKKADWSFMKSLHDIDFSRENKEWEGRCINYRGGLEDKTFNHKAVASYLLNTMGLELPESLDDAEEVVLITRASNIRARRVAKKEEQQELPISTAFEKDTA
ncbi:MAG: DGQHR domain-containing protein [Colwellia sp.]|jgi:DGQHR domain-containing protein